MKTFALLTLNQATALVPGASVQTLKRRIRQGKLWATRPGKEYLTTAAAIEEMANKCRVVPKVRTYGSVKLAPAAPAPGLSSMDLASSALDSALAQVSAKKPTHGRLRRSRSVR